MDRWTGIPKAAETAERIFRETHAISAMTSSTPGYEVSRLKIRLLKALQYRIKKELTVFVSSFFSLTEVEKYHIWYFC